MTIPPATPWLRRLPHRPVAAVAPAPPQRVELSPPRPPVTTPPPPPSRPAPSPQPSPSRPAPSPSTGLTQLGGSSAPAPRQAPASRTPALTVIPPRGVSGAVTLDATDPVVRLDAIQSGIGPLEIHGADRVAWEHVDDLGGVVAVTGASTGDDVPAPGNRPLVALQDGGVLVNLRHVRDLRRLLVDAPADRAVTVSASIGGVVRAADPAGRVRISIVVVDGRLELRAEYGLPDDWREALAAMGWSALASIPR